MAKFIRGEKVIIRDLGMEQKSMFGIPNSWKACKVSVNVNFQDPLGGYFSNLLSLQISFSLINVFICYYYFKDVFIYLKGMVTEREREGFCSVKRQRERE